MREEKNLCSLVSSELSIESLLAAVSNSLNVNPSGVVYHSCLQHESFLTVSHLSFKHVYDTLKKKYFPHSSSVNNTSFLFWSPKVIFYFLMENTTKYK